MKADKTTKLYAKMDIGENHTNVNKEVKAVIVHFGGEDIIVSNDNFGTRRKYADFTKGKERAGLNQVQIVFSGIEMAVIMNDRYIDKDGNEKFFAETFKDVVEKM